MKYIIALIFCLFMGVTAIGLGFGALFPPMNRIAQPIVCSDGEMAYKQSTTRPLPGRTYIQATWACVDSAGKATPISTFSVALVAGSAYGMALFVLVALLLATRRSAAPTARPPQSPQF